MFQLGWYFYAFFALLIIYAWVSGLAYLHSEKGKKGLVIGLIYLLAAVISTVMMYKHFTTRKTKVPVRQHIVIHYQPRQDSLRYNTDRSFHH